MSLRKQITLLVLLFAITPISMTFSQKLPKALIITGNGNVPNPKKEYPSWIHEFQNDLVTEILRNTVEVNITEDLSVLTADQLAKYDLVISNSIFLTPSKEQLEALHDFVSGGKSYMTIHCGILSLLNWDKYEQFIGGIFIGGPSTVPSRFKVVTENTEFWGYKYQFRKNDEHPVSIVVDDFVTTDELYYFQPSTPNFHVIARAENLPVMWWHPVGKGKVMSLTLGHDEAAKSSPGYQQLLINGIRWLTGMPLIQGKNPRVFSNRQLTYTRFISLNESTDPDRSWTLDVAKNPDSGLGTVKATSGGAFDLTLTGKPGNGKFSVQARNSKGYISTKEFDIRVVTDGVGNIAPYFGNTATSSSSENESMFHANNLIDGDSTTRWSSAATDTAWVVIDLQKKYPISRIVLDWEASFARRYAILGSDDGTQWKQIHDVPQSDGGVDEIRFNPVQYRYIKILGTERANKKWGYSLYEVRVFKQ